MNTRKKIRRAAPDAASGHDGAGLDQAVLGELQSVIKLLSDQVDKPEDEKEAILVARLVEGLSADKWLSLSKKNNLRSWLALPLADDAAKAIGSLTDTLDKLVFQRDHDPLTGLANRRYMERFLHTEMDRAARTNDFLSLIMLDLDRFKGINDSYGHICGDKVLQKLGSMLVRSQRPYDLSARYGGEEFVVILPGVSLIRASVMAERLLGKFNKIAFKCSRHETFHMTFSGGVASISPKTGYTASLEEFVKMADGALYAAKRNGRNRIEVSALSANEVAETMVMAEEKQFLFFKSPE